MRAVVVLLLALVLLPGVAAVGRTVPPTAVPVAGYHVVLAGEAFVGHRPWCPDLDHPCDSWGDAGATAEVALYQESNGVPGWQRTDALVAGRPVSVDCDRCLF